jgi:hypothetical protein
MIGCETVDGLLHSSEVEIESCNRMAPACVHPRQRVWL